MKELTKAASAIGLLLAMVLQAGSEPASQVLVLVGAHNDPYDTALDTLRTELKDNGLALTVVRTGASDKPADLAHRCPASMSAIAALGPEALSRAIAVNPSVPVIAGMVLRNTMSKENANCHLIAATVDVPFETLLDQLRLAFPKVSRVSVIRNPSRSDPEAAQLQATGKRRGFTINVADCSRMEALLDIYAKLAASSEVVICFPDASLYNSTTIEELILRSIRLRVPVAGFSEGFARAGALFSVYPDYEAAGREIAHAVVAAVSKKDSRAEWPLKSFHTALNLRVARMTGLKPDLTRFKDLTVVP